MPAIAAITINDGQATPVAHTFNPVESGLPMYQENGNTTIPAIGYPEIATSLRKATADNGVNKAMITLKVPVLETVSGSTVGGYAPGPKVAYFLQFKGEVLLPARSTGSQRKDLRVMFANLLTNAQVVALVDSLEKAY